MAAIITFAEQRDGKLRRPSLEAVSEARRLSGGLSASVEVVLIGSGVSGLAGELAAYGADKAHLFDQPELAQDATEGVAPAGRARVMGVEATASGKLELTEAQIVVSAGLGIKGPEQFQLVEALAQVMGAAVGASRAVVDAGWVDHHFQV